VSVNIDSVLRAVYYKYMHPKVYTVDATIRGWLDQSISVLFQEVFVSNGILAPEIARKKEMVRIGSTRRTPSDKVRPPRPVDIGENGYAGKMYWCCLTTELYM
jgi:hypothetical protein